MTRTSFRGTFTMLGALAALLLFSGCTTTGSGTQSTNPHAIKSRTASCNCGQLTVKVKGPDPERISLCHCNLCQKQSGSAFAIQARFPKEQVTIQGESTVWAFPEKGVAAVPYRNCASEGAKYHFCATAVNSP